MKVAIISQGFEPRNIRLQPHRTLLEMGRQLAWRGNDVVFLTDESTSGSLISSLDTNTDSIPFRIRRIPSVQRPRPWRASATEVLARAVDQEQPQMVLWHISFGMLLHQNLKNSFAPLVLGLLTSPVVYPADVLRLGIYAIRSNTRMIAIQLVGAMAANSLLRRVIASDRLSGLITLSEATRNYVIARGVPAEKVQSIGPGVDADWLQFQLADNIGHTVRQSVGFGASNFVITYFGSPAPVRGTYTLLKAVEQLVAAHPQTRLLLLLRHWGFEWQSEITHLHHYIASSKLCDHVHLIDGYISEVEVKRYLACSDLVCLPFELLPSDAPLSIIECMALGLPVVTTSIASIPELVPEQCGLVVPPHQPMKLARCIERLIVSPGLTQECGLQARQYVKTHHTWDIMGENLTHYLCQQSNLHGLPESLAATTAGTLAEKITQRVLSTF